MAAFTLTTTGECQSGIKPGAYSGYVKCLSGSQKVTDFVKWEFDSEGEWTNVFPTEYGSEYGELVGEGEGFQQYETEDVFPVVPTFGDSACPMPRTKLTMYRNGTFTASIDCFAPGWYELPPVSCSGKLTYTPFSNNISLSNSYAKFRSKCYTVKRPVRLQYGFEDTGGYYALFKLYAQSCGGSQSRGLVYFQKYASSASKYGAVTLPAGRWRFTGTSTDEWWVEGVPGVK